MATHKPIVRTPAEGRTVAVVGDVYRFLATGENTNSKYAMWEANHPDQLRVSCVQPLTEARPRLLEVLPVVQERIRERHDRLAGSAGCRGLGRLRHDLGQAGEGCGDRDFRYNSSPGQPFGSEADCKIGA